MAEAVASGQSVDDVGVTLSMLSRDEVMSLCMLRAEERDEGED